LLPVFGESSVRLAMRLLAGCLLRERIHPRDRFFGLNLDSSHAVAS
jgi:hypothetical protein